MDEFRICSTCGYSRGFHISFRKSEKGFALVFICPDCGSSFELGLVEDRLETLAPVKGPVFHEHEGQS